MAKHNGVTIRIGAAYDRVEINHVKGNPPVVFDRSEMRKDGKKELQGGLRRAVVDTWTEERDRAKGRRAGRVAGKQRDKVRREHA